MDGKGFYLLVCLGVVNHVLVGVVGLRINAGLSALDGEGKGVHDNDGVAVGLPLHEAHDLDVAAGAGVDHHLEKGQRRDLHPPEPTASPAGT